MKLSHLFYCRNEDAKAVITISSGKFFSNGFDLAWLAKQDKVTYDAFIKSYCGLVAKMMTYPLPSIAAINGK